MTYFAKSDENYYTTDAVKINALLHALLKT